MIQAPPLALNVAVASALSGRFDLDSVAFAQIEGRVVGVETRPEATLDWNLAPVSIRYALTDQVLRAIVPFSILVSGIANGEQTAIVQMAVTAVLTYRVKPSPDVLPAVDAGHFAGVLGFMHAWPYLRATVQDLTMKLGLPGLTLPVVLSGMVPSKASATLIDESQQHALPTSPDDAAKQPKTRRRGQKKITRKKKVASR